MINSIKAKYLLLALLCLCIGTASALTRRSKTQTPAGRECYLPYDGIDISKYQSLNGPIDWAKVATDKNIKFIYIKATEGTTHVDPYYKDHLDKARRHGFKVGSYHFFTMKSPVKSQFDNFKRNAVKSKQDLIPVIDLEIKVLGFTRKQLQDSVMAFADLLRAHYGCEPLLYVGGDYMREHLTKDFADFKLFMPRYSRSDDAEPKVPFGAKWSIWQFSQAGTIKGIKGTVDMDCLNDGITVNDLLIKNNPVKKKNKKRVAEAEKEKEKEAEAAVVAATPLEQNVKTLEKEEKALEKKLKQEEKKLEKEEKELNDKKQKAEAKKKAEAEAKKKAEAEAKKKAEAEAKKKAEAEAKKKAEAEAKKKAEAEAKKKAEAEAKKKAEAEAKKKAEAEAKKKAEAEAKKKAAAKKTPTAREKQRAANKKLKNKKSTPTTSKSGKKTNKNSADNE